MDDAAKVRFLKWIAAAMIAAMVVRFLVRFVL